MEIDVLVFLFLCYPWRGGAENEKFGMSPFQYKKMVQENWEEDQINGNNNNIINPSSSTASVVDVIKQEDHFPQIGHLYGHNHHHHHPLPFVLAENDQHHQYFQTAAAAASRPLSHHHQQEFASSSPPRSCVTTAFRSSDGNSNNHDNVLIFSGNHSSPKPPEVVKTHHAHHQHSSQVIPNSENFKWIWQNSSFSLILTHSTHIKRGILRVSKGIGCFCTSIIVYII